MVMNQDGSTMSSSEITDKKMKEISLEKESRKM
jgi:hypothetical protein